MLKNNGPSLAKSKSCGTQSYALDKSISNVPTISPLSKCMLSTVALSKTRK